MLHVLLTGEGLDGGHQGVGEPADVRRRLDAHRDGWGSLTLATGATDPDALLDAAMRIIEPVAQRIGATTAVVARDVTESGNTSAASIPIALSKLLRRGELQPGAPVLLLGFGGGLSYAGQIVRCP